MITKAILQNALENLFPAGTFDVNKQKIIVEDVVPIKEILSDKKNKDKKGSVGKVDINKSLSEDQIKNILQKTASDLGWGAVSVEMAGSKGYQIKRNGKTLAITKISDSDVALLVPGAKTSNLAEKFCDALPQIEEGPRGGSKSNLTKLSGFDACHSKDYSTAWRDLPDCHDTDSTMAIIGNYWIQSILNVMKEGKGVTCEAGDSVPVAKILIDNLLEILK